MAVVLTHIAALYVRNPLSCLCACLRKPLPCLPALLDALRERFVPLPCLCPCLLCLQLDSWSVGALAYDVLCGRAPFAGHEDVPREEEKKGILFHVSPVAHMVVRQAQPCLLKKWHVYGPCSICMCVICVLEFSCNGLFA